MQKVEKFTEDFGRVFLCYMIGHVEADFKNGTAEVTVENGIVQRNSKEA